MPLVTKTSDGYYQWKNNTWVGYYLDEYTYDAVYNITEEIYSNWYETTSDWIGNS